MDLPSPPNSSSAHSDEQSPENIYMTLPGSPTRLGHSADGSFGSDSTMDWAGVFWPPGSFDHAHVDQSMEIDPQLLSVSPAAIFGTHEPTIANPLQLATPQELAGLAPLLEAFPFDFDLTRFDNNVNSKQPTQHIQSLHNFTPSPSPESQSSADDDIARIAREKAGVMHAVIATGSGLALSLPQYAVTPRQQPSPAASTSSSTTGSPPPTTPSDVQHSQPPASGQASASEEPSATKTRPKTSHTTIERRYRTNLNARIVALRAAIPATAHLDAPGTVALDARGRADGVTPARKGSKATILAKAVEYITVLKAREIRLRRDTDGLRNLVCGLVGGEQLLNAWEASWRAKWGTMEDDEARLAGESVGGSDDEDSDDEDSRPAKRAKKAAPAPTIAAQAAAPARKSAPGIDPITGEKRKRGRPRKVPVPPAATAITAPVAPIPMHVQQPQPQYLLAVFALFSLWSNAPAAPSSAASSHTGSVVADGVQPLVATTSFGITWVQAIHLVASVAVLASVAFPIVRRQLATLASKRSPAVPVAAATVKPEPENDISDGESEDMASSIMSSSSTFSSVGPGTPLSSDISDPLTRRQNSISVLEEDEPTRITQPADKGRASGPLARALGATGAVTSVLGAGAKYALSTVRVGRRTQSDTREAEGETIDGWARLAEALVAEGDEAPFATKLQTYLTLSAARPRRADHRVALALLANSLGLPDAARTWDSVHSDSPADRSVLNRLGLEDATDVLLSLAESDVHQDVSESALRRLAREWVRGEAQAVAKEAFMCVARGLPGDPERLDELKAVAAELGGREAKVALVVSACYGIMGVRSSENNAPAADFDGDATETEDSVNAVPARDAVNLAVVSAHADADFGDQETEDVVRVLTLFCAHTSAGRSSPKDTLALLQLLGRQTFDAPALEDARDRMVDVVRAGSRRAALPVASC